MVLAAVAALLVAGYLLWLRDSSLVEVRTVEVTGLSGADSGRIRAALGWTARSMTTLHVDREKLERAVAGFPAVRAIEVRPELPHGIRIHVLGHRPAAVLVSGARRVPVAGDGTVLAGVLVRGRLPLIRLSGAMPAKRISEGRQLASVRVAGSVPPHLRSRVEEIGRERKRGVVVHLEDGKKLIFGDGTGIAVKWAAVVAVLADPAAAGAAYVDVRIPERPAAGGLPVQTVAPVAPAQAPAPAAAAPALPTPPAASPTPAAPPAPAGGTPAQPTDPAAVAGDGQAPVAAPQPPAQPPVAEGGGTAPNAQP